MLLLQRLDAILQRHTWSSCWTVTAVGGNAGRIGRQRHRGLLRKYVETVKFKEGAMAEKSGRPRLIVGISGASGVIYGARLLELLRPLPVETHLVISRTADVTLAVETDLKPAAVRARADVVHANSDMAAPISSGSFKTMGMVVAPCSIRSMAEIASGVTTTLLSRA